jgi:hypothetical protein
MMLQNDTSTLLNEAESPTLLAQASSVGSWQLLPYSCPINPVHAALLRTGKVLFVSGSGNDPDKVENPPGSAVWNVSNGTFSRPENPLNDEDNILLDLFCGGHSFLSDGRLLFAGGTQQYDPFYGLPVYFLFDPIAEQYTSYDWMPAGRWYPTLVTVGTDRVLAVSGLEENGLLETYPSIYSTATGWTYYEQPTSDLPMYSHLFLLSSGKLFFSGACFFNTGVSPRLLTLPPTNDFTTAIAETPLVSGLQNADYVDQAASVLLPPAQDQKVMIIGGGNGFNGQATTRVNIVDLKANIPTYKAAPPLKYARMHHNAVILPDRTVFVCNGGAVGEDMNQGTRTAEIYNPSTNTWTVAATASVTRLYHALALLLPDGRVATAGGNPDRGVEERRLEIYSPPYMSKPRPVISSAPSTVPSNGTFTIGTSQATNIKWVSLIKPMATTHGLDTEQRLVNVTINSWTNTSLSVTVTTNRNIAPRGWYMLFITDQSGVPSVAKWIKL